MISPPFLPTICSQAEDTGLPDASYDLAALTFIVHELPSAATKAIATEVRVCG